ncbi:MAG: Rrf2 family transcriptional regulator [Cytophagales bacterium]|nr:Rrf2 family transcriptional regulator [Cytophagales bacterium]
MFSKACNYGIRAMVYISQKSAKNQRAGIKEIAKAIESPEAFTGKILQQLSRKKLVESVKGPRGGFFITEEGRKMPLVKVVEAIDGDQLMKGCALGFSECSEERPCPLHNRFVVVRRELTRMLEETRLEELSDGVVKGDAFLHK